MVNLRRFFLVWTAVVCQFTSHVALASRDFRIDDEHFTLRLSEKYRFIDASDTVRIMIEEWGNPASQIMEQDPLGMIVDQNFPQTSNWGIIITASHDGHISDHDATDLADSSLLSIIRKEYFRMNRQRKAVGAVPVTSINWALEPQYNRKAHQILWAKDIGFGNNGMRTLNYAVRTLGRENAIHFNAVGSMDQMNAIAASMQSVLAASSFDDGFRYRDFNARYHRTADYGLVALIAGQPKSKANPLQNILSLLNGSGNLMIAGLGGIIVALGRWLTRRRLPEF